MGREKFDNLILGRGQKSFRKCWYRGTTLHTYDWKPEYCVTPFFVNFLVSTPPAEIEQFSTSTIKITQLVKNVVTLF